MLKIDDVYKEYGDMVYKYLMSLCHNQDLAEELTQETFYQAVKSCKSYNGKCKVSTWLCQIAKHMWYREVDKNKRNSHLQIDETIPCGAKSPPDELCLQDDKMRLIKAIHILNETAKEVVLLRITGAFSFKEIGEVFDKNENWARVTFYRAKQELVKGREG